MNTSAREAQYRRLLFQYLPDQDAREIEFFVNERRFDIFSRALGHQLAGRSVLNVGCGPFALEFYLAPTCEHLDGLDIDAQLGPLHAALLHDGLIPPSCFQSVDIMAFEPERTYDVIIINDVLYSKHVDCHQVLAKYAKLLNPGGYIYFDVLDARAAGVWSVLNPDQRYRRYCLVELSQALGGYGLEVIQRQPSFGIKGGADRLLRQCLWALGRVSNNVIFLAQKSAIA